MDAQQREETRKAEIEALRHIVLTANDPANEFPELLKWLEGLTDGCSASGGRG